MRAVGVLTDAQVRTDFLLTMACRKRSDDLRLPRRHIIEYFHAVRAERGQYITS